MQGFHSLTLGIDIMVVLFMIIYLIVVYLPVVFTFTYLPVENVPYYDPSLYGSLGGLFSERYYWEFWVFVSDLFRFILPFGLEYCKAVAVVFEIPENIDVMTFVFVILTIWETIKLIWRGYEYGFCTDFQFCRNFNPSLCHQKFDCPANDVWLWVFWTNFVFFFLCIAYMFLLRTAGTEGTKFRDNFKKGIIPKELFYLSKKPKDELSAIEAMHGRLQQQNNRITAAVPWVYWQPGTPSYHPLVPPDHRQRHQRWE